LDTVGEGVEIADLLGWRNGDFGPVAARTADFYALRGGSAGGIDLR
jgi:hypothetical protein